MVPRPRIFLFVFEAHTSGCKFLFATRKMSETNSVKKIVFRFTLQKNTISNRLKFGQVNCKHIQIGSIKLVYFYLFLLDYLHVR